MKVNAMLVEKTSQKGNPYVCVEIYLTDKVKKVVFLDEAEIELIKLFIEKNNVK